jgi:hypothetical protein
MRILSLLLFLLFGAARLTPCDAAVFCASAHKAEPRNPVTSMPVKQTLFKALTPARFRHITGRKLSVRERLTLKIYLWKERRRLAEKDPTERQVRQGRLSLIFGSAALVLIFLPYVAVAAIPLAIAGLVLGIKSLKGNSNTMGILGVVFSGLVLFIFLLSIAIVSILLLTWGIR